MPKREDEYWVGTKEPKGRGLCPFCGSSNVYYNKRYNSWRCGSCEQSFPSPSYGPGGDFGKEARWFGKTTDKTRRREFAEAARKKRATKWKKSPGSGLTAKKAFLIFLIIACSTAAIYTGYLLFTHRIDRIVGIIILAVNIGVLIWNISLLRKWRVRARTVVAIAIVIALLFSATGAFAGVEPLASYKDNIAAKVGSILPQTASENLDSNKLHGTYTATIFDPLTGRSARMTATFTGDTMTFYNELVGKGIYEYFIPGDLGSAQVIILTDVATNETTNYRFKYVTEYNCFTIWLSNSLPATFYR